MYKRENVINNNFWFYRQRRTSHNIIMSDDHRAYFMQDQTSYRKEVFRFPNHNQTLSHIIEIIVSVLNKNQQNIICVWLGVKWHRHYTRLVLYLIKMDYLFVPAFFKKNIDMFDCEPNCLCVHMQQ